MKVTAWNNSLLAFLTSIVIIVNLNIVQAHILPIAPNPTNKQESITEIVPTAERNKHDLKRFSKIEFIPSDTLILRGKIQNLAPVKSLLAVTKLAPPLAHNNAKWNIKIYGDGTELKFPPFFERILQRIQTYFSVYKYTDTSEGTSTIIPGENITLQVTVEPTSNATAATTLSFSINSVNENTNKIAEDIFGSGDTDFHHQQDKFIDIESTTQGDSNESPEFIAIDDNDNSVIVVGED